MATYDKAIKNGLLITGDGTSSADIALKGVLAPGYYADTVIFDPQREKTITPFLLHEATGWPRTVLLRGKVVLENEQYVGQVGDGGFVGRE